MILADKIIEERKKLGLSQEELAEKLSVSRQAVSKWESAQSVPDLQKIIAMSELFSVTTDYLLKDDAKHEKSEPDVADSDGTLRRVSMEEANAFMSVMRSQSKAAALGVLLCVLSPVLLIFLAGLAVEKIGGVTETAACVIGLAALFIQVAAAVFLFVTSGSRSERFGYLETEEFETAYGVTGLVKEKNAAYEPTYVRALSLGIVLCVLSPLPLIVAALMKASDAVVVSMTALLLCIVAVGVYMIVRVSTVKESYQILLQEGEYRRKEKKSAVSAVSAAYWCIVTAGYLAWSFISNDWKSTWIVWPIAGVLCVPVLTAAKMIIKDEERDK
ncbi:MAG: helix-turn-helix domain-containing protein [Clostridia bacterium]|nr:helix-turn-helix domain-containing protein [Clostridia bacterium]